jgi:hypothetical protein
MKLLFFLIAISISSSLAIESLLKEWVQFKRTHSKLYATEEEEFKRFHFGLY